MRKHTLLPAAFLAALACAAQKMLTFTDPSKNIEVQYSSGIVRIKPGPIYQFDVQAPGSKVHAIVHDEGLDFLADRVQGEAATGKGPKSGVRSATASGGVKVTKTANGSTSTITGSTAKYTRAGSEGSLSLAGPVHLTNYMSAKSQNLVATGSSVKATLATPGKASLPLKTATLAGPVVIDATYRSTPKTLSSIHASGNRLEIDNAKKPATLTLIGNVDVSGSALGQFHGIAKAVLTVNDRGEIIEVMTMAGGGR